MELSKVPRVHKATNGCKYVDNGWLLLKPSQSHLKLLSFSHVITPTQLNSAGRLDYVQEMKRYVRTRNNLRTKDFLSHVFDIRVTYLSGIRMGNEVK